MKKYEMDLILHQHGVYDTSQYLLSARSTIIDACYCKDIIQSLCLSISDEHDDWRNNLEWQPVEGNQDMKRLNIDDKNMTLYKMDIVGIEISKIRFQNMMIKSFFQCCRNAFDTLAQAANCSCLASKAKKIKQVDFGKMLAEFEREPYNIMFPTMSKWFSTVKESDQYKYIDNYCNRTKHVCEIPTSITLPLFGNNIAFSIASFIRPSKANNANDGFIQFSQKEIAEFIPSIYSFLADSYKLFFNAMLREIPKRTFVSNRHYTLQVYQQYFKGLPKNSFSCAVIISDTNLNCMPDKIQVLLVAELRSKEGNSIIKAQNCPFDRIYVTDSSQEMLCSGAYVTNEKLGEDALLEFRTYTKCSFGEEITPLVQRVLATEGSNETFYHQNHFVQIITNSDDADFLKQVSVQL